MTDQKPALFRNTQRGVALVRLLSVVVALAVIAIGAWFLWPKLNGGAQLPLPGIGASEDAEAPADASGQPVAPIAELSIEALIKEARNAYREQRYVAPAGNNALEYYLRVLDKEPGNRSAQDALREDFDLFTGGVEQAINANAFDEAERVIGLLAKADPSSFTLTILRSKLDAKRKQFDREQALATAAAARAAPTTAASAGRTPESVAEVDSLTTPAPAPTTANAPKPVAAAKPEPAAVAPASAPAVASGGETRDAVLIKQVPPQYPIAAMRKRQEGWVEVQFQVDAAGNVIGASVVNSDPPRVFDREAVKAVESWKFNPRMENGKAVEAKARRRRIEFKLGAA